MPKFRFGLRAFILVPLLLSIIFVFVHSQRMRLQDRSIFAIERVGGMVHYDETLDSAWNSINWNRGVRCVEIECELLNDPKIAHAIAALPAIKEIRIVSMCQDSDISRLEMVYPNVTISVDAKAALQNTLTKMFGDKVEVLE